MKRRIKRLPRQIVLNDGESLNKPKPELKVGETRVRKKRGKIEWNRSASRVVTGRGKANWNDNEKEVHRMEVDAEKSLPQYVELPDLSPKIAAVLEKGPGTAFVTQCALSATRNDRDVPILWPAHDDDKTTTIPAGMLIVYIGHLRSYELRKGRKVTVLRHTFLVGSSRFIIAKLDLISPLE